MAIKIGDQFFSRKHVTEQDIKLFADVSGDHNPLHLDAEFASNSMSIDRNKWLELWRQHSKLRVTA